MKNMFSDDVSKIFDFIFNTYNKNSNESVNDISPNGLQLSPITLNAEYRAKWNIHENNFIVLSKNGEIIRPTLYRIGGMNNPNLRSDKYFMLLKYVEAYYPNDIIKHTKSDPKHLEGRCVIIDADGNEKIEFKKHELPYLLDNSCIYHIGNKYYNIESGELYCESFTDMKSDEFLFLNNQYDKDHSKRGVMKINKKDGTFEIYNKK